MQSTNFINLLDNYTITAFLSSAQKHMLQLLIRSATLLTSTNYTFSWINMKNLIWIIYLQACIWRLKWSFLKVKHILTSNT